MMDVDSWFSELSVSFLVWCDISEVLLRKISMCELLFGVSWVKCGIILGMLLVSWVVVLLSLFEVI